MAAAAWLHRSSPWGTMSLTAYVGRFVVSFLLFILGTTVFAWIWSRYFRRGPLEYLLHAATRPVKYLR